MLKKFLLALVPVALLSVTAKADDDALSIDLSSIQDAGAEIVELDLDIDVDQLSADAGADSEEDAVEACFRRFRYRCGGWGHRYGGWRGCYSYCRPIYRYHSIRYCRPIYRIAAPVYHHYWGCH